MRGKIFFFLGLLTLVAILSPEKVARLPLSYTDTNLPLTLVEIQGNSYLFGIDTGGLSHIRSSILQSVNKKKLGDFEVINIKNIWEMPEYSISKIRLDRFIWRDFRTTDYTKAYSDETLVQGPSNHVVYPTGIIGGALLEQKKALFDFPNSVLYLCKTESPLKKLGYDLTGFYKVPIVHQADHFIPIEIETDFGKKVFVVDTGCTYTILRNDSSEKMVSQESQTFRLGGKDFGPFSFYEYPLPFDFPYEGCLGMDFIKDKALYIDRNKGFIYLRE